MPYEYGVVKHPVAFREQQQQQKKKKKKMNLIKDAYEMMCGGCVLSPYFIQRARAPPMRSLRAPQTVLYE